MNRKLCLLFLVCLAVVLVKSESSMEIDENGDEYDVKRFNIQGRQLNGGRSQCVETRRKRSTVIPVESEEESNEDYDDDVMQKGQVHQAMLFFSPPVANYGGDADDDEDDEDDEKDVNMNENNMQVQLNNLNANEEDEEDMVDEDDNDEDNVELDEAPTIEVVQLPQLPVFGQLQSQGQSVGAIASASNVAGGSSGVYGNVGHVSVSHVGNGGYGNSGHVSVSQNGGNFGSSNGITVVHSHDPPKVNPQTHAVFELVPVNAETDYDDDEDDDDDEADEAVDFKEEVSPVTTTAIWSTGDDNSDLYNDLDNKPLKPVKKKPTKVTKKPTRRPLLPKRKNKKKINNNKNKKISGNRNRRVNNKRRPNRNGNRRRPPINKRKNNKIRRGNKTRRRPAKSGTQHFIRKTRPVSERIQSSNKNKNDKNTETKNKTRIGNANKRDIAKKRKNKNNLVKIDKGTKTFTKTVTMTQTGGAEDEPEVNCIIIRKDPPPAATTPRPFWNILGRNANGTPAASGQYGRRKRINFRYRA